MQKKISIEDKDRITAEVNEHVLQNALKQRCNWRDEHKLDDKQLFKLFGEFSSMMQIYRMQENSKDSNSVKVKLEKLNSLIGVRVDPLAHLFPINSNVSSLKYNRMQKEEEHKQFRLNKQDLKEFKVPI